MLQSLIHTVLQMDDKRLRTEHLEELLEIQDLDVLDRHILSLTDKQTLMNASRVNRNLRDMTRPLRETRKNEFLKYKNAHDIHIEWLPTRPGYGYPQLFIRMMQTTYTYVHRRVENGWEDAYITLNESDVDIDLPLDGDTQAPNLFQSFYSLLNEMFINKLGEWQTRLVVSKSPYGPFNPEKMNNNYYIRVSLENNEIYELLIDALTTHLQNTMKNGNTVHVVPARKDSDYDWYSCYMSVSPYGKPSIEYPERPDKTYDTEEIKKYGKTLLKTLYPEENFHVAPRHME